ncbi:hypothetical protein [Clostridium pasteurianum]|uniref:Uncharacterized protein n=1 Tax=Clostridium pasteurianum BC1 TaxID=86416 RepID=R4KA16_CLOPA|nr:hypothetical protein [Clostridium pasteurianum]AGK97389.1 hypothetical protein Clopa_2529 [Clostridium pasteurianum BC1]
MVHDETVCSKCNYKKIDSYSLRLRHCKKCDNYGERTLKADIIVNQRPVSIKFDCPHCDEEIEIDYQEFIDMLGEPCDWNYSKFNCPRCEKEIEIDEVDWD